MNPGLEPKISTLQQVLDSGLPYYWQDYGTKFFLFNHQNPTLRKVARTSLNFPVPVDGKMITDMVQ